MRQFLRSKIHRLRVTSTDLDSIDSIVIDKFLLEKADMVSGEKVFVCSVSSGVHWETYVTPGEKLMVSVKGSGAKLCKVGDILIVSSFEVSDFPPKPKIVIVDRENKFEKMM